MRKTLTNESESECENQIYFKKINYDFDTTFSASAFLNICITRPFTSVSFHVHKFTCKGSLRLLKYRPSREQQQVQLKVKVFHGKHLNTKCQI